MFLEYCIAICLASSKVFATQGPFLDSNAMSPFFTLLPIPKPYIALAHPYHFCSLSLHPTRQHGERLRSNKYWPNKTFFAFSMLKALLFLKNAILLLKIGGCFFILSSLYIEKNA